MRAFTLTTLLALFVACSSEEATTNPTTPAAEDGGSDAPSPSKDGGAEGDADAGGDAGEALPQQEEIEPNDGATLQEVQPMTIPGVMAGAIDPANDQDVFSVGPAAGELWEWKVAPTSNDLAPHLTVFDAAPDNVNPTVLARGAPGMAITIQHFVLGAGSFLAALRDARNVPTPTGQGGASFGYTFTAQKRAVQPTPIALGATKTGTLASLSSVALYSFTLAATTDVEVIVRAERKTPPSTLDSRLSIFSTTTKKSLGTNDDASGTSDSELGGPLPAGAYVIVLDNEGTNGADLSYEIELAAP